MKTFARSPEGVHVPWATLVKILAAILAGWAIVRLWPSVQLFLVAVLFAVALSPIVDRLEVLAGLLIVVVLGLYLLFDGRKVVAWLLAYVPRAHRRRMGSMVPEMFEVVQAFTTGQMLISTLFSIFTFVVLTTLNVPAALPLALFAGLCDVIPVAGISVATVAASLSALTVSPSAALTVFGIYVCYHLFEAYVLVPRLYGNRLRLSTLTVLLAILAGGTLGGVIGAVLALPIVAAYPVFEKHWLDDYLNPDAVEDHRALRDTEGKESDAVVEAVLQGATPRK